MSLTQIREAIENLSLDERWELSDWLIAINAPGDDDPVIQDSIAIANQRMKEIESGKAQWVGEDEFWTRVREGTEQRERELDSEVLKLAHQRAAELAHGTKKLIPEEQVWQEINAMRAQLG